MFGDPLAGVLLCARCLEASERLGPWAFVVALDEPPIHQAARRRGHAPGPASPAGRS